MVKELSRNLETAKDKIFTHQLNSITNSNDVFQQESTMEKKRAISGSKCLGRSSSNQPFAILFIHLPQDCITYATVTQTMVYWFVSHALIKI